MAFDAKLMAAASPPTPAPMIRIGKSLVEDAPLMLGWQARCDRLWSVAVLRIVQA